MTWHNTVMAFDAGQAGELVDQVAFNEQGLVPVVAQQFDSGSVLMLAWMNRAALEQTLQTGRATYWSRSRQQLWEKGETSGNRQSVVSLAIDCDGDSLLLRVDQSGPACHTGLASCFDTQVIEDESNV